MRIAFYLNLQGAGHCRRFESVAKHFPPEVELAVIGMGAVPNIKDIGRPITKVKVPDFAPESTVPFVKAQRSHDYHDFLVNHGDNTAFTYEMVSFLNSWRPDLVVSDVGLEASILARLCGIPSMYGRQHGVRWDKGHTLAYEWACSLIAPFSEDMEQENCPQWIREKTFYSGGFNRFSDQKKAKVAPESYSANKPNILVMTGFGGTEITAEDIARAAAKNSQWDWHVLGVCTNKNAAVTTEPQNLHYHGVIENVWPYLCHADLVVANAGHNSTMEIAAAGVPSLCIPAPRPFEEQVCKAEVLRRLNLSIVADQWPDARDWPALMESAGELKCDRWDTLQDADAPKRAANHIFETTKKCMRPTDVAAAASTVTYPLKQPAISVA